MELVDIFNVAAQQWAVTRKMTNKDVVNALLMALCTYVQANAPYDRWEDMGDTLAEELRQRLTIRQVN